MTLHLEEMGTSGRLKLNCSIAEMESYQILAEDHGRKPVGESVPLKQMKENV
jgi:hypothetical protein